MMHKLAKEQLPAFYKSTTEQSTTNSYTSSSAIEQVSWKANWAAKKQFTFLHYYTDRSRKETCEREVRNVNRNDDRRKNDAEKNENATETLKGCLTTLEIVHNQYKAAKPKQ